MFTHDCHRLPALWPLILACTLALVPGCSVAPEPQWELVQIRNSHGTISCYYVPKEMLATLLPKAAPAAPQVASPGQQFAGSNDRRQENLLYEQDLKRQREASFREEQRNIDAYQAARQQIVQSQRSEEQARNRDFQEQQRRWVKSQRLSSQADAVRWAQASKPFDIPSAQDQRQELPMLQAWQDRSLRLGQ